MGALKLETTCGVWNAGVIIMNLGNNDEHSSESCLDHFAKFEF